MTTLPSLSFQLDNAKSTVRLFSLDQPITANGLASNVTFVQWDGVTGTGRVYYNDRAPLPEIFTDPSSYQTYINQWITGAETGSPALTLAQAQAIKVALVQSIFGVKRQQSVNVTVTGGNFNWDASDQALARMAALAGDLYIDPINTLIAAININVGRANGFESDFTTFISQLQTNLDTWVTSVNTAETASLGAGWATISDPAVPASGALSQLSTISSVTVPSISVVPVGATSAVSLSPTDLKAIMAAIATQNANEQLVNNTKVAAINALSTIASVISYDATTGW